MTFVNKAEKVKHLKMAHFIIFAAFLLLKPTYSAYQEASVYMNKGEPSISFGKLDTDGAAVYGFYNKSLLETGWSTLEVKGGYGAKTSNNDIMYAAGFLEGVLTAEDMWMQYNNIKPFYVDNKPDSLMIKLKSFLKQQDRWVRNMITKGKADPFWKHVSYIVSQFDGLYDGYKIASKGKNWDVDVFVVQLLNNAGDFIDLVNALSPESIPEFTRMTHKELLNYVYTTGHCSAIVKITGAFEDLFMSHSSWFTYSATNRIYKHYNFNVDDPNTAAKRLSFSSYPGFIESLDDFYIMDSDLVMLQTTNNVFNKTLYTFVQPESLLAWQRVRVANMMARSGKQWADTLKQFNSGTYNNQYMVIDLSKIKLGVEVQDDALWVVEQIPTLVKAADQTSILRAGYWPSYNVPFYEEVYNMSGYPSVVAARGTDFSYQLAPRAKIFRRDQSSVTTMDGLKAIMRYNDYQHDKYSEGNPCNAICCRGDLDPTTPRADGCYDTKVTKYNLAKKMKSLAINGPTLGTGLKPFSWTGVFNSTSHMGLPTEYNFGWVTMKPSL